MGTNWPSICGKCGAVYNDADDSNLVKKERDGMMYCYCGHCHTKDDNLLDKLLGKSDKTLIAKFEPLN
jgi:hypothetical protein